MSESGRIRENVDVLIVGSGPAGSTFARIIGDEKPGSSILMVEVGPRLSNIVGEHTMNMSEEERLTSQQLAQGPDASVARSSLALTGLATKADDAMDGPYVFPGLFLVGNGSQVEGEFGMPAASMSSGVGGMGVHWSGSCPRPSGPERISFIDAATLDEAYATAESLLAVSKDLHVGDELLANVRDVVASEFEHDAEPIGFMPGAMTRDGSGFRTSGTSVILGDVAERVSRFELRTETIARRIILDGGAAVGAQLEDRRTGDSYEVNARRVVVCADSLRTPQVLFASGIRPPALGHYLNEHFQIFTLARLHSDYVSEPPAVGGPAPMGSVRIPLVSGDRAMQGQVVLLSRTGLRFPFGDASTATNDLAIFPWYGAKDIQYSDCVQFSETATDYYGMPAMTIHYTLTDTDRRTIELLEANTVRSAKLLGEPLGQAKLAPGGSSLHYQGTIRMGAANNGESVCDTYSRVWGVEHLYVGGNGVIPTSTAANPTLTNVALAVRAAQKLASSL